MDATPADETEVSEAPEEESSGRIVSHLQTVAGVGAGVIGSVIEAANQVWSIRDGVVARRLSRQAREPLANLYELFPEARQASPHELGMRFVPVEEIRGTAVAGAAQRGGDFLPLKPFRGENWEARWRRLRDANDRLQPLPPVDLIKYDGEYWVVDGHNRVAVTLYANGVGLDAMVTELVSMDGQTSERPRNLLSYLGETGELRAAASGHRPAIGMRQVEQASAAEAAVVPEDEREARDDYLSRAFLRPFAEILASRGVTLERPRHEGHCPACGSAPIVSYRKELPETNGGARFLVCGLCGTDWPFNRIRCPSCQEEDPAKLPGFQSDVHKNVRIEACETCRGYVKSLDLTLDARPLPEVDDLVSLAMDLWAIEEGWTRLEPGWAGI